MKSDAHRAEYLLIMTVLVWTGIIIGVSGMATPVKFTAPSLTLPVALEVGQATFHLLTRVEWGLTILLGIVAALSQVSILRWLGVGLVVGIVAVQALWLLPALEIRVEHVITGRPSPPSSAHLIYVVAEGVKILTLLGLGLDTLRRAMRV